VHSHWQGGQSTPGAQAGQAQPQPLDGGELAVWHTPDLQLGSPLEQGAPKANHWHCVLDSERQLVSSVSALQGSGALGSGEVMLVLLVVPSGEAAPPGAQSHWQGAQAAPGGHSGHAQVQVPWSTQPDPPPSEQLQSQGGQASPGTHAGHTQVQLPPPPPPPPEQSHSALGQSAPAGQASGVTQAQSPPLGSLG
jgi:hypothetical protein